MAAPAPSPAGLQGAVGADVIQRVLAFPCPMTSSQIAILQSVRRYLADRDEETYTAAQGRFEGGVVLVLQAKGMTRQRAEDLAASVPRAKVQQLGWSRVILANEQEGWAFDMARP